MFAFINSLSPLHLLVIGVAALLLFGNRLPEVARSMGKAINEIPRHPAHDFHLRQEASDPAAGEIAQLRLIEPKPGAFRPRTPTRRMLRRRRAIVSDRLNRADSLGSGGLRLPVSLPAARPRPEPHCSRAHPAASPGRFR
ncbi:MAG: twin-arginine translocase TatA/TatE family subunit [Planctomycetes bacterium]|nr:twin-arginine translocase TatA/TatE family subunit [Planctomycetota bacterium]